MRICDGGARRGASSLPVRRYLSVKLKHIMWRGVWCFALDNFLRRSLAMLKAAKHARGLKFYSSRDFKFCSDWAGAVLVEISTAALLVLVTRIVRLTAVVANLNLPHSMCMPFRGVALQAGPSDTGSVGSTNKSRDFNSAITTAT